MINVQNNFTFIVDYRDHNDVDVPAAYHQLLDTYQSSESEDETRPSTSRAADTEPSSRANGARRYNFQVHLFLLFNV